MKKKHYGLKDYFITGVFALLPLVITVWVVRWSLDLAWDAIFSLAVPNTRAALIKVVSPEAMVHLQRFYVPEIIGFALILCLIIVVGFVARRIIGRSLLALVDKIISAIPGVNFIYSTIRQFIGTMDPESPQREAFSHAVVARVGSIHVLGFLTSHSSVVGGRAKKKLASVYIPSNQLMQGYTIMVADKDIIRLDMKVDDAFKYLVSFGMVAPAVMHSPKRGGK